MNILRKILGTKHQRDLKLMRPLINTINELDEQYQSLTEQGLRAKTEEFKNRLVEGETLDDIMCEAFAAVKNCCRRLLGTKFDVCEHEMTWDMVPFDVQLIGGIVLHQGKIAEMATGEGKTLVATMPLYLNSLAGRNVHLITTNDFLARRDAQWMGLVYNYLGLEVGCIQNQMLHDERRIEYSKDITYGTNSEFGFDYLRDNGMAFDPVGLVQSGYHYAIIDEVDSILIDEARTPLIISGPAPISSNQYKELKPKVAELVRKQRTICGRLIQEARELLEQEDDESAQLKLYQVHHGMPKHKQLMHMLEDPDTRRLHEQIENSMLTDMRKEQARALREQLFFTIDERGHDASLTEQGCTALNPNDPDTYVLPDIVTAMADLESEDSMSEEDKTTQRQQIQEQFSDRSEKIHNVDQLIRAYCLYEKDIAYVVQNNRVLIVDEFTGRILPGRRWSDGLHQAVEAKEGVNIERETQTLATITIQNYFRMYDKLAGMTGTAETEASEFHDIYGLDVIVIPTNRPVRRVDNNDVIYKTQREKYKAIIEEIADCHERGQPALVGTASVDTSEIISRMLKRAKIPHSVLNAKNHEREADIVTRAGQPGAVTIATNMAGRGTDIKLGEGVVHISRSIIESAVALDDRVDGGTLRDTLEEKPSGLHVVGSERHEARRIDRQLRGRCARQGDPGSSRFYVSLEDDLMRLFGSHRIANIMSRLGLEEGQQLEHRWLNRSIETAQRRVEQQNYSIRKRTLEYDDVMNRQREVIYGFRGEVVRSETPRKHVYDVIRDVISTQVDALIVEESEESIHVFTEWVQSNIPIAITREETKAQASNPDALVDSILTRAQQAYDLKVSFEDETHTSVIERHIVLHCIDTRWQEYLRSMDALREGVGLRAYGQRDPLIEYKREAFEMFAELMDAIKQDILSAVFRSAPLEESSDSLMSSLSQTFIHQQVSALDQASIAADAQIDSAFDSMSNPEQSAEPLTREAPKVGRNDPCPCGSGKKHKKCCGR